MAFKMTGWSPFTKDDKQTKANPNKDKKVTSRTEDEEMRNRDNEQTARYNKVLKENEEVMRSLEKPWIQKAIDLFRKDKR